MIQKIILPFPPTVNTYYRHIVIGRSPRTLISARGRQYRDLVAALVQKLGVKSFGDQRLAMHVLVCPPDRRRRDLGNVDKSLADSLMHAGVFNDDSQIDRLSYQREPVMAGGCVHITLETLEEKCASN